MRSPEPTSTHCSDVLPGDQPCCTWDAIKSPTIASISNPTVPQSTNIISLQIYLYVYILYISIYIINYFLSLYIHIQRYIYIYIHIWASNSHHSSHHSLFISTSQPPSSFFSARDSVCWSSSEKSVFDGHGQSSSKTGYIWYILVWHDATESAETRICPSQTSANKVKAVATEPLALCLSQTRANDMMFFLQIVTTHVGHTTWHIVSMSWSCPQPQLDSSITQGPVSNTTGTGNFGDSKFKAFAQAIDRHILHMKVPWRMELAEFSWAGSLEWKKFGFPTI